MSVDRETGSFVERFGRFWEDQGGSRIAGKIIGWMTVCDPPHQSVADLVEALGASHGSISTQTRRLESLGYLERETFTGDRTSYFILNHVGWAGIFEQSSIAPMSDLRDLGIEAQRLLRDTDRPGSTDLVLMADYLLKEWPAFLEGMKDYIAERSDSEPTEIRTN